MATAPREEVLDAVRNATCFLLVTHEHPDGDALGSLVAMQGLLRELGKDSVMYLDADEFPLPYEYEFMRLDGMVTEVPADVAQRVVVYLDCGNLDRSGVATSGGSMTLNVDHHHDNTCFATVNHVDAGASCTAEMVWDLMRALGVAPSLQMAEALYVGLVTDTGRFMYENTGARAHVMASELIEAGVDVHDIFSRLYEDMPESKLVLQARALSGVARFDDGALTFARITAEDFAETGALQSYTEGIIDHLRAVRGTKVAALAREVDDGARCKVSLRATDDTVDVSAIARSGGGGGHRQAAGFTTEMAADELIAFLREAVAAQLVESLRDSGDRVRDLSSSLRELPAERNA